MPDVDLIWSPDISPSQTLGPADIDVGGFVQSIGGSRRNALEFGNEQSKNSVSIRSGVVVICHTDLPPPSRYGLVLPQSAVESIWKIVAVRTIGRCTEVTLDFHTQQARIAGRWQVSCVATKLIAKRCRPVWLDQLRRANATTDRNPTYLMVHLFDQRRCLRQDTR